MHTGGHRLAPHPDSNLKRLMILLDCAIQQANPDATSPINRANIERLATEITHVMLSRYRIFHTLDHVFDVAAGGNGIETIAALFHDLVYYQVDKRIHPDLAPLLADCTIHPTNFEFIYQKTQDPWNQSVAQVFGLKEGQLLNPLSGLNEFLSALVAARRLENFLPPWQIIQVVACIEMTIPFRSNSGPQGNFHDQLKKRLSDLTQNLNLSVSDDQLNEALFQGIRVANRDIAGFYSPDFSEFISGTWNLILENNPILKNPLYTVSDYRKALQKVRGFFQILKPDVIIQSWNGSSNVDTLKAQAALNLGNAILYLDMKLIEMTLLETLALLSGGDAPYFLLLGELNPTTGTAPIEKHLPVIPLDPAKNTVVYTVLRQGRKFEESFDFRHAPLAAYLYSHLSSEEITDTLTRVSAYHSGKLSAQKFIKSIDSKILQPILAGLKEISWSRLHFPI